VRDAVVEQSAAHLLMDARAALDRDFPHFNRALRRRLYSESRHLYLADTLQKEALRVSADATDRKTLRVMKRGGRARSEAEEGR
jgi:hypothetical protein